MTVSQWETVAGVALLIIAVVGFIAMMSILDGRSRRERGLPKKEKRIRGRRRHEK
jgi:uncharacterized integral membrane protein